MISAKLDSWLSVLHVEKFNVAVFSDTMTNVIVFMMVLLVLTTFSDRDHISKSQQCQTVFIENVKFLVN